MSDESTGTAAPVTETSNEPVSEPIAGKFADEAAFSKSARELMSNLGIKPPDDDVPLWGEGRMYRTLDDAVAFYQSLERIQGKVGGNKAAEDAPASDAPPPTIEPGAETTVETLKISGEPPKTAEDTAALLNELKLDGVELAEQWKSEGRLTDEQYAAFQSKGFGRAVVDDFIAGKAAQAELMEMKAAQIRADAIKLVGGEEAFGNMARWAAANLAPEDIEWFNSQVDGPNIDAGSVKRGMEWLNAKYAEANGGARSRSVIAGEAAPPASAGFSTTKEYFDAVKEIATKQSRGEDVSDLVRRMTATPDNIRFGTP